MAYTHTNSKGQQYYLHRQEVPLKGGRLQTIYFFAREPKADRAIDEMPAGYVIVENARTGLPILKKG